jgi:hypothetical protein
VIKTTGLLIIHTPQARPPSRVGWWNATGDHPIDEARGFEFPGNTMSSADDFEKDFVSRTP